MLGTDASLSEDDLISSTSMDFDASKDFDTAWSQFMNEQQQHVYPPIPDEPDVPPSPKISNEQRWLLNTKESDAFSRFFDRLMQEPAGSDASLKELEAEIQTLSRTVDSTAQHEYTYAENMPQNPPNNFTTTPQYYEPAIPAPPAPPAPQYYMPVYDHKYTPEYDHGYFVGFSRAYEYYREHYPYMPGAPVPHIPPPGGLPGANGLPGVNGQPGVNPSVSGQPSVNGQPVANGQLVANGHPGADAAPSKQPKPESDATVKRKRHGDASSRNVHKENEKRRRTLIKSLFEELSSLVPEVKTSKGPVSKSLCLERAYEYILSEYERNQRLRQNLEEQGISTETVESVALTNVPRQNAESQAS